ncbi:MAG: hypothetical protein HKN59_02685 [Gammaproteobacteria bacterium]|nr:hypothetical protein [Gammaproteobacteria bacterium]
MSFAEIVLRLGVTFVSWLVIYMHMIMLLVVGYAQCPDTSAWRVSLVSAAFAGGAAFALRYGHGVHGSTTAFRYFALPLIILIPLAAWNCLPYFAGTTLGDAGLCAVLTGINGSERISDWERAWAPAQVVVLAVLAFNGWRAWADKPQARA